jgi:hypothetical protein
LKQATIISIDLGNKEQPISLSNNDVLYSYVQIGKKPKDYTNILKFNNSKKPFNVRFYPVTQYLNFTTAMCAQYDIEVPTNGSHFASPQSEKNSTMQLSSLSVIKVGAIVKFNLSIITVLTLTVPELK